ncbi:unnamed protein product [Caenorhabditis auriculariae]|uniref:Ubiquitin-like domain-containing protein n=1 Tax=Caenorhabditis auriculariae TaxID=2777116 RepID=A0A8S1GZF9_9PELO|nr:unnamed protein product [Caenorhabditis auriculariae]
MSDSDSDSDCDMYTNFTSKKAAEHKKLKAEYALMHSRPRDSLAENERKRPRIEESPLEISILDDDEKSDVKTFTDYTNERIEKACQEIDEEIPDAEDVHLGDVPQNFYPTPSLDASQKAIKEALMTKVNTSMDQLDIEVEEVSPSRAFETATFMISNLEEGGCVNFELNVNDTFESVREMLVSRWECEGRLVGIRLKQQELDFKRTPCSYGMAPDSFYQLTAFRVGQEEKDAQEGAADGVLIKFQLADRRKPLELRFDKKDSVGEIREALAEELEVEGTDMRLIFDNEELEDEETVGGLDIEEGDCMDVYLKS